MRRIRPALIQPPTSEVYTCPANAITDSLGFTMRQRRILLPAALGVAILAVSTASILIRLAQADAPSITIAALRLTLATILLAPFAIIRHGQELHALERRQILQAAAAGAFLALHFATWISSLEFTSVASSVVLVSTGPLWVAMLSPLFLGERIGRGAVLGVGLALLGGFIISSGEACSWNGALHCEALASAANDRPLWGNFLALVGAWAVSGYLILGRHLRSSLSLLPYIFLVYGFAALALIAAAVTMGELELNLGPRTYLWILLLAVVPQLIGHSTYNWALRYVPAAVVAVTTLGEPIGSAILAYFVLREVPGTFATVGAALILTGIFLAARGNTREENPDASGVTS